MKRRRLPTPNVEWPPPADEPEVALFNIPRSRAGGTNVVDVNSASRLAIRTKPIAPPLIEDPVEPVEPVETSASIDAAQPIEPATVPEAVQAPQPIVLEGSLDDFPIEQRAVGSPSLLLDLNLEGRTDEPTDEPTVEPLTEAVPSLEVADAEPPLPSMPTRIPPEVARPSQPSNLARTAAPSAQIGIRPSRALENAARRSRYRTAALAIGIAIVALGMFFGPLLLKRAIEIRTITASPKGSAPAATATASAAPQPQTSEAARGESEPPPPPVAAAPPRDRAAVDDPPLDRQGTSGDSAVAPVASLREASARPAPAAAATPVSPLNRGPADRLTDREPAPSPKLPTADPPRTRTAAPTATAGPASSASSASSAASAPSASSAAAALELNPPPEPTPIPEPPATATIGEAPRPEPARADTPRPDPGHGNPPAAEPRTAETARTEPPAESPRAGAAPPAKEVTASEGMAAALKRLQLAYSRRDAGMVKEVWPSVDERALGRVFDGLRSQSVTFDRCETRVTAPTGEMQCHGITTYVPRIGAQATRSESRQWRFRMQKSGDNWVIDSVTARE